MLDAYGATHALACVSIAGIGAMEPELRLVAYRHGAKQERLLAQCRPHGEWITWRDAASHG